MGVDPCFAAAVEQVKIESVSDTDVTFSTRGASRTGDIHESLLRTFTVPRSEVFTGPVHGFPPCVELAAGNVGIMYLSRAGFAAAAVSGFEIHGAAQVLFKIPDCAAAPVRLSTMLTVIPSSIVVRGHLEGEREFFDLELLGPDAAESQSILWTSAECIAVRLSPRGARRLRVKRSTTARVWPVQIKIKGQPAIDLAVSGEVDVLDVAMAERTQELAYLRPGAPIKLALSQDGVGAFHVTPQVVAERSGEPARVVRPCHGCAPAGRELARKRVTRVTRRRSAV